MHYKSTQSRTTQYRSKQSLRTQPRSMQHKKQLLLTYVGAHFIVDFACAFLMLHQLGSAEEFRFCFLIYNFCAFALQMPLGLMADRINRNSLFAAIGCGLIVVAFGAGQLAIPATILAGLGNGMFHVGGGTDVLNSSENKPTLLGVFVSPGAMGIFLGALLGRREDLPMLPVILLLLIALIGILYFGFREKQSFRSDNAVVSFQNVTTLPVLIAILCLFLVVILRSYLGLTSAFSWKSNGMWAAISVCAVVCGKASGGLLAARLGAKKAALLSLSLAAVFFLFSGNPIPGVAAVFFFNMTMPISLWAIARILRGSKGFSFGLLTFGLFLGFLPVYFEHPPLLSTTTGFCAASVISLGLLLFALRKVDG